MSDVNERGVIKGSLQSRAVISGTVFAHQTVDYGRIDLPQFVQIGEEYEGEYIVVPSTRDEQTLLTKNKLMAEDVTVRRIPYYETSNLYGKTVYIGED